MKREPQTKKQRLDQLLGLFGDSLITREQFEMMMRDQNLTDEDIDFYYGNKNITGEAKNEPNQ